MSGFISLHREAFSHPLLKDAERFRAWFWLVANAAWKDTKQDARGKTIEIKRGQICISRERLAEEWKWSASAVERFLTRLKTEHMIERETGQGKSVITICKYDIYQASSDETGQTFGQQTGQTSDRHRTAKEKGNKEIREEEDTYVSPSSITRAGERERDLLDADEISSEPKPGPKPVTAAKPKKFAIPPDWSPLDLSGDIAEMLGQWPPGRLESEIADFREYWTENGEKRAGWDRTFRSRIRTVHSRVMREAQNGNHNRQADWGTAAGDRGPIDRRDGFTRSLDETIAKSRSGEPPGATGRSDFGPAAGDSYLPAAATSALR